MSEQGRIAEWNDAKGFGWIAVDGGERLFFHISAYASRGSRPAVGADVVFVRGTGKNGRPCATAVKAPAAAARKRASRTRPASRARATSPGAPWPATAFCLALAALGALAWYSHSLQLVGGAAAMSTISFLAYGYDKSKADRGHWRTKESTLLLLDLFGGWPGGLFAQQHFRHKNRKTSYQVKFWLVVLANVATLYYLDQQGNLPVF
ncbi:DUF1294 domain-containing protein [Niveibacterium sp. SC-1]|uniref:DUF1294 domain-containing protein n=1 Tax=Niveibacterium sp. SC-1 TaxID=3135646 RepID=UPI00311FE18C